MINMKFSIFSGFLYKIESISGRNNITEHLATFLPLLDEGEIEHVMYFLQGRISPVFVDIEFNLSRKLILKGLSSHFQNVNEIFLEKGDSGLVVEHLLNIETNSNKNELSIVDVYNELYKITSFTGKGSQDIKLQIYMQLIKNLDPLSAKYITRIIEGNLRLGVSDKTVLDSLSFIISGDKNLRKNIDRAYGITSDIGILAKKVLTALKNGKISKDKNEEFFNTFRLIPGIPVASKLVERESSVKSTWDRMPFCFVQPKLDGLRGQIHLYNDNKNKEVLNRVVKIFSRNMEDITDQFPDIVGAVLDLPVDSIILDSEIIGYDSNEKKYLSYQETMQRKRKYDVQQYAIDIPVKAECFDVIYINGEDISMVNIEERLDILKNLIENTKNENRIIDILETVQMSTEDELDDYFTKKVSLGLEGIITKKVATIYEPGTRNFDWIKLKANTQSNLVDTLDVVILGYYVGRGQRSKHGFGALLTGVYNKDKKQYETIGKVGSGFKDEEFKKFKSDLSKITVDNKPDNYVVENSLIPDFWVEPKIIIEVEADEITRSPSHTACRDLKSNVKKDDFKKGLSFRFPRLKVWNRDKISSTTSDELIRIYELSRERIGR